MVTESAARTAASVYPTLRYRDAPAAIRWLVDALGFTEHAVYPGAEGRVEHAQLAWGQGGMIMLGSAPTESDGLDTGVTSTYLVVGSDAEVDTVYARALATGGLSVREPRDEDYGGRDASVRDPEGNVWSVGSYQPSTG